MMDFIIIHHLIIKAMYILISNVQFNNRPQNEKYLLYISICSMTLLCWVQIKKEIFLEGKLSHELLSQYPNWWVSSGVAPESLMLSINNKCKSVTKHCSVLPVLHTVTSPSLAKAKLMLIPVLRLCVSEMLSFQNSGCTCLCVSV